MTVFVTPRILSILRIIYISYNMTQTAFFGLADKSRFLVSLDVEINPPVQPGDNKKRSNEEPPLVRGGGCGETTVGGVVVVFSPSVLPSAIHLPRQREVLESRPLTRLWVAVHVMR